MRGKQSVDAAHRYQERNIPAYAGKTTVSPSRYTTPQEHPRVCGENLGLTVYDAKGKGTSPRMRGKLTGISLAFQTIRNIPAYAGKTNCNGVLLVPLTEHPRVCGENPMMILSRLCKSGTSPRMRGKLRMLGYSDYVPEEHPRVCGENSVVCLYEGPSVGTSPYAGKTGDHGRAGRVGKGTSPRMRGKHLAGVLWGGTRRNIPAYAGKTHLHIQPKTRRKEHPRVCGENLRKISQWGPNIGTSPRMRGKPILRRGGRPVSSEHPRVCGENGLRRRAKLCVPGTSPRMRGKPTSPSTNADETRNIPAYAGKTCWFPR